MAKFNAVVIKAHDGTEIHFVTRGKAKSPTMDEIADYCAENNIIIVDFGEKKELIKNWAPPNSKVFLIDLRYGMEFCAQKYGVTEGTLQHYVKNKIPHINLDVYGKK